MENILIYFQKHFSQNLKIWVKKQPILQDLGEKSHKTEKMGPSHP